MKLYRYNIIFFVLFVLSAGCGREDSDELGTRYDNKERSTQVVVYTPNQASNVGDTVYSFDDRDVALTTIWDAGGTDMLRYVGTKSVTLDLREGEMSTLGMLTDKGASLGIALGSIIENVSGGSGDDLLIANGADNQLSGGAGADQFVFMEGFGNDLVLDFEKGVDALVIAGAVDSVDNSGSDAILTVGTDTITVANTHIDAGDYSLI